jgi:hypothetical protein
MPRVIRLHNAINSEKQRTPLIDPRIDARHLPLSKVECNLGFSLNEARRLFPPTLKTWESIEGNEELVSEAKLFAHRGEGIGHRYAMAGDLFDRHRMSHIVWGTRKINAHTDENDPSSAEVLNLYEDTTYLAKRIIANNHEIVRPLKLQRSAESLKCVNEPEPDNEGVSAQGRQRL